MSGCVGASENIFSGAGALKISSTISPKSSPASRVYRARALVWHTHRRDHPRR
jgi:hypothetical protein